MRKSFKDLKFTDDFMFCRVMQENEDVCKGVIESILGFEIGGIVQIENQKSINITEDGRGVRFDIFLKDDRDTVYDIEMQTCNYSDIAKRSRYYQSMLDRSLLKKSHNYHQLNDSYIIFIMLKDVFGLGYNVYEFESTCTQAADYKLNDGAKRIFVNAEKVNSGSDTSLGNLISYLVDGEAKDALTSRINECVEDARLNPRMEVEFMTLEEMKELAYDEGVAKGLEQGLEQGKRTGVIESAIRTVPALVERGLSVEEACELAGVTVEEFKSVQE